MQQTEEESPLAPLDPEIERTFRRRKRDAVCLREKIQQPRQAKMGDKTLRDLWIPQDQNAEADQPAIQANNFELKPALISMVQHNQFGGTALESPLTHIRNFLEYCNTLKCNGVPHDFIKMQLFPFSLRDGAKHWFHVMPEAQKDTWPHLLQAFYGRYFPPTKAVEFRDKITRFSQFDGESLYDAWKRFQGLLKMCPNHGQEPWLILQTFYKGLTQQTRAYVDSAAGGGIMSKTLDEATELIERMASHDFSWNNERVSHSPQPVILRPNTNDSVSAQLEAITKQLSSMMSDNASVVSAITTGGCQACGNSGHQTHECTNFMNVETSVSEVNYAQNQGPFTQSYNPSWRNHPNLSYKSGNQFGNFQPFQPSNASFRPNHCQGQSYQESSVSYAPSMQSSQVNQSSEIKELMKQQALMFSGIQETLKQQMQETLKQQSDVFLSAIQQLTAGSGSPSTKEARLPSQTEENPRGQCGAVTVVDAVTTRTGRSTEAILPRPSAATYVTPARRTTEATEKL